MKKLLLFLAVSMAAHAQSVPLREATATEIANGTGGSNAYVSARRLPGGVGGGDASTNTASSVDSEIAVFSGTGGKTIKRATGTGIAKITAGVLGTAVAGTDYAPTFTFGALSSNTITLGGITTPYPTRDDTWSTSPQTLTIANTTYAAGQGGTVNIHATVPVTLTISAAGGSVYRNGSTTILGATTIAVPVGNHTFRVWTPNTGSTLYLEDTVVTAANLPVAATATNYTAATPDAEANFVGINTALGRHSITFVISGAGSAITTGVKDLIVSSKYAGTLTSWSATVSPADTITFDILRSTNAADTAPVTSIVGGTGTKPNVASGIKDTSTTFTSWTSTAIAADDNFKVQVTAVGGTATAATVTLYFQ